MATLDEISKEKERLSEALARVDAQRDKLAAQLGELAATERVLARYSKGTRSRKTASASRRARHAAGDPQPSPSIRLRRPFETAAFVATRFCLFCCQSR